MIDREPRNAPPERGASLRMLLWAASRAGPARLPNATNWHTIGAWKPANGESRLREGGAGQVEPAADVAGDAVLTAPRA
jgi:hypothetical protein